jgi:flagellin
MIANNALQKTDKRLSESLEKLSSGLKIVNAKDNPSGLAMSRRMNSQIEGLGVANDSSNDAISIVQVADGSLSEIHEVLQRMNELAVKASNGTLTEDDRKTIQEEVTLLKEEIERMANTTQFNGQNILDGSFDLRGYVTDSTGKTNPDISVSTYSENMDEGKYVISGLAVDFEQILGITGVERNTITIDDASLRNITIYKDGETVPYMDTSTMVASIREDVLTLSDNTGKSVSIQFNADYSGSLNVELTKTGAMTMQVGANEGQTLDIRIDKVSLTTLGIHNVDMTTEELARESIDSIKYAITQISSIRSRLGAYQNRLEHTVKSQDITVENMTAAYSRIMDVDMAEEMTVYSTQQVLSQAGTSMMAQANERPSQVLQLLQ